MFICVWVCVHVSTDARVQKGAADPLELELQVVVTQPPSVDAEIQTQAL